MKFNLQEFQLKNNKIITYSIDPHVTVESKSRLDPEINKEDRGKKINGEANLDPFALQRSHH